MVLFLSVDGIMLSERLSQFRTGGQHRSGHQPPRDQR
jgi:hypothetical protein